MLFLKSYNVIATTCVGRDGKCLVAGGRSNLLHLWSLENNQLIRAMQMPHHVHAIRQLEFLPDIFDGGANQVLTVVCVSSILDSISHSLTILPVV